MRRLAILKEKGTTVPPSKPGSDAWLARRMTSWAALARVVRRG